jgi:hypothetical protein
MFGKKVVATTVVALSALAGSAHATLIWDGDASRGTDIFSLINKGNCFTEGSSSITAVQDPAGINGLVWRYHKTADSNRCENHGMRVNGAEYRVVNGELIYFGWRYRITTTANNNANFQWKSFGDGHQQNFPFVIKNVSGTVRLMYTAPGGASTYVWQHAISPNQWNHVVLRLQISSTASTGSADLWWNGVQQTFSNGSTRTFGRTLDVGDHNCPKWGAYGLMGTDLSNYVDGLRAGTTYADVAAAGSPTPTPTPAPQPTATPAPRPTPTPVASYVEVTPAGSAVTASTNDGNVPANTVDNNLTTRWSANGDGQWIQYDLGTARTVGYVKVAVYNGNSRQNRFDIQVSSGSGIWSTVWSGSSSGTTTAEQTYDFTDVSARWVRYLGHGNTVNAFNSVTEVSIFAAP